MITVTNLSMRFGGKILFKNVSFQLNPSKHYGLVGANGSGKSTLLKILTDELKEDSGSYSFPSEMKIGSLKQNHYIYEHEKILDVVIMGKELLWKALVDKDKLLNQEELNNEDLKKLESLEERIRHFSGYTASSDAAKLLEGLGIKNEVHDKPLSILSGGYKLRVLLAQVLFSGPDLLLLDEPTNHLDIFSIDWLQGYLASFPGTILVTSHDRNFLNAICHHILDVDHQTIKLYKGNFDQFLETKAFDLEQKLSLLEKQEKKKEDLQEFINRFKAKASKASQAQSKMKLVMKLESEMNDIDLSPSSRLYPNFYFSGECSSPRIPLIVKEISKSFGQKNVLHQVHFQLEKGDKLAILGENGIGKSTLLEILTNHLIPTEGSFTWGQKVKIAYFPQDHKREIKGTETLLEWIQQFERNVPEQKLREILGQVLFTGDDVKKTTGTLSGGEMARLILAKMMLLQPNVLLFDEPTNHLDMESTDALIEALQEYQGTIIFVSHNRHFISKIANRILEITSRGIQNFNCNYNEYLEKRKLDLLSAKETLNKNDTKSLEGQSLFKEQKNLRNLKNQIQKKVDQIETKSHQIELKLKKIEEALSDPDFYQTKPKSEQEKILNEKIKLENELETLLLEWEQLSIELLNIN